MSDVIEIHNGLVGFARGQGLGMFVAVAVGEVEQADGDTGRTSIGGHVIETYADQSLGLV